MEDLLNRFKQFKTSFDNNGDLAGLQKQLVELKIGLLQHGFLQSSDEKQRNLARDVLEHAALVSVKAGDVASFERNVTQLQGYYAVSESPLKYEILGLNLVRLLAANKMADFHTELELIPVAKHSDRCIQYPVQMEQYMMEGSFHKVIVAAQQAPSPSYALFVQRLAETVRIQIAECIASAYTQLTSAEAVELLMLNNAGDLQQYESQFDWKRGPGGHLVFSHRDAEERVPKAQVMAQTLAMAEELERII